MAIEKRPNGRYRARVWNKSLDRYTNLGTFPSKAAALAASRKAEIELTTEGFIAERKDITLGEMCDLYISTNTQLRPTTLQWYEQALKPAKKFFGESESVRRLRRQDIARYVSSLVAADRAAKTVCSYVKVLAAVLELAVEWDYRPDNPARRLRNLPVNKRAADAIRIVTPAEHRTLVASAPRGYEVMFSIWPFVGLRRSEMQGLTWSDIDLDANRLHVRHQLREDQTLDPNLKTPKSARTMRLSDQVAAELRAWKIQSRPNAMNLVFPTPAGRPQSSKPHFYKVWNTACRVAGLVGCNPHDMRHAFATWSLAAGQNPKLVADEMGHEKPSMMLDFYLHLLPEDSTVFEDRVGDWYRLQGSKDGQMNATLPILSHAADSVDLSASA